MLTQPIPCTIIWTKEASDWLDSNKGRGLAQRIEQKATELALNPRPPGVDRIEKESLRWHEGVTFRIRVGEYRIIYADVLLERGHIVIIRVMARDKVYK